MKTYKAIAYLTKKAIFPVEAETIDAARIKARLQIATDTLLYHEQTVELDVEEVKE